MRKPFFSMAKAELFKELDSSESGLSAVERSRRLQELGSNEIPAKDRRTAAGILLAQFKSPLILILVAASIIAGFLGDMKDAAIIIAILAINALLGFFQEFKSERVLAELRKYISFKAKVFVDGEKKELPAQGLVPGDIVFIEIGDIVPADLRLVEAQGLSINEAAITGESMPAQKSPLAKGNASIAFLGTTVLEGEAKGIVIATGKNSEFGKTATVLSAKEPQTDFQKNMKNFGDFLVKVILALTAIVFLINAALGKGVLDSTLFALALAVGITPELLPVIITIGLSAGAMRLAAKKVVVKRLVSIEDLGNAEILCMDKTGTLTENKLVLESFFGADGKKNKKILEFGLLCNSAVVEKGRAEGNIIDAAIWNHALKNKDASIGDYKKLAEIEFDYGRRMMSVVVETKGKRLLVCKGAPESVLGACSWVEKNGKRLAIKAQEKELWKKFLELSKRGYLVISLAFKDVGLKKGYSTSDEKNLVFAGFLSFSDPPKKGLQHAIESFERLGVELKILTGDNEFVAEHVCKKVGLSIKGRIVLGSELEKMPEQIFLKAILEHNAFARITPEQKYRIVEGFGRQNKIVGFLGDGVNDAPALKAADIGITVDSAVDVAKDSADIVLLQKSLLVIADGIKDGRKTFSNMMKYVFSTISANFGNMFTLAFSSLFLKFIPLLPTQILLANLLSDGPMLTVSTDNVDAKELHRPRRWHIRAIANFMVFFGIVSAVFDFITIAFLLFVVKAPTDIFRTAWFLESVLSEIVVVFAIRSNKGFWKSNPSKALVFSSVVAILLSVWLVFSPFGLLFSFEKLNAGILLAIAAILIAYFFSVEILKKGFFARHEI